MIAQPSDNDQKITLSVARLYERRPYPHYPLLAKPRWQDGYLMSSLFAQSVCQSHAIAMKQAAPAEVRATEILIAGCGEILPYLLRKWEPRRCQITAVDLSRRSLRRARFRLTFNTQPTCFVQSDIVEFLGRCQKEQRFFRHIESYGMFHHLADPEIAISRAAQQLVAGGTMRAMIYNAEARRWIHAVQDLFVGLGFSAESNLHIRRGREILRQAANLLPRLDYKLKQMGDSVIDNRSRFADTFLHPHEVRYDVAQWLTAFAATGLELQGIFDRYGELDDLPNPLYLAPTIAQMSERAADLRFENNLELYLRRPAPASTSGPPLLSSLTTATALRLKLPPHLWFSFPETAKLGLIDRLAIWHGFQSSLATGEKLLPNRFLSLPPRSLQRLSRLGAIHLTQVPKTLHQTLLDPMVKRLDAPALPPNKSLAETPLAAILLKQAPTDAAKIKIQTALENLSNI